MHCMFLLGIKCLYPELLSETFCNIAMQYQVKYSIYATAIQAICNLEIASFNKTISTVKPV